MKPPLKTLATPLARLLPSLAVLAVLSVPATAAPLSGAGLAQTAAEAARPLVTPVAQGCGPGAWRGPWGGCRSTPYYGPLPGGGYAAPPGAPVYYGNGCPPGWWRGPWGHCRDTPYHGRLPNGGWQ